MADTVLDALRSKYPQYKDVPDDTLTLALGRKYPQYLANQDFAAAFGKLSQPNSDPPSDPTAPLPLWAHQPPVSVNAQPAPPRKMAIAQHTWTPSELAGQTPPPEPREGLLTSLPRAVVGDVAAGMDMAAARKDKVQDAEMFSGNIPAALMGEDLPIDQLIKSLSGNPDNAVAATLAKTSMGIASTAPMAAIGGLPGAVQKLIVAGFTVDMARHLPATSQALGEEFAKPKDERDYDKITSLISDAIQQIVFTTAGVKHLEGAGADAVAKAMVDKYVPRGTGINPPKKGAKNARSIQTPATIHGDVQSQPVEGEWQVPVEESVPGVQSQAQAVAKEAPLSLTPVTRPAASTADIIAPEYQKLLDLEKDNVDVPVDVLTEKEISEAENSDDPFAQKKGEAFRTNIATIDRNQGRIVINPKAFNEWLSRIPANQRQAAVRSLIGEERIHLATDDAAAKAYWKNLTGLEQAIVKRRYGDVKGMDDTLWGHEALRFRMQQLARMTPRELAEAVGREKWTLKGLTVLESAVRGIRETLGTKASAESRAILDRIQENIDFGKTVAGGASPGAIDKNVQDLSEQEAKKLEEQARMYLESGDAESAAELKAMAAKLRGQTGEQYFPGARQRDLFSHTEMKSKKPENEQLKKMLSDFWGGGEPMTEADWKKIESTPLHKWSRQQIRDYYKIGEQPYEQPPPVPPGERLVTIRRPDGSTYTASFGGKYWDFTAQGRGRVPAIAVLKEGKWSHGTLPPGHQIVEQHFPGARPKKRPDSVFQEKFILPGMETKWDPEKGFIASLKFAGQTQPVAESERTSAEAHGALPRLSGQEIQDQGQSWVHTMYLKAAEDAAGGRKVTPPSFKDFMGYLKGIEPKLQPGHAFGMWQQATADVLESLPGEQLQSLAKAEFGSKASLESIVKAAEKAKEAGETARLPGMPIQARRELFEKEFKESGSVKEGSRSIWDRPIPNQGDEGVLKEYSDLERELDAVMDKSDDLAEPLEEARDVVRALKSELRQASGSALNNELLATPADTEALSKAAAKLTEAQKDLDDLNDQKSFAEERAKSIRGRLNELKEDYKKAQLSKSWRAKVISAIYRRMVKTEMSAMDARINRREVTPEEIRHGAPFSYEDVANASGPELATILRSDARRSREDAPNITRRLVVLRNPRTGTVHVVDAYPRGEETRVLDPISPNKKHVLLDSIMARYQPLYSILLDEPVRSLRMDYKNLTEYQQEFGKVAEADKAQEDSYDPLQISGSEFAREIGGRMPGTQMGHLQGPERQMADEFSHGVHEQSSSTPMTDAESSALADLSADAKGPSDVEDALREIDPSKNRMAFSALTKLGRRIGFEYPFATPDELVSKTAERLYELNRQAKSLDEFRKKLAVFDEPKEVDPPSAFSRELTMPIDRRPPTDIGPTKGTGAPEELPPRPRQQRMLSKEEYKWVRRSPAREAFSAAAEEAGRQLRPTGRMFPKPKLPEWYSRGTTKGQRVQEHFPGARPKAPSEEKSIAKIIWDSLFQLTNAREADFRDALPAVRAFGEALDKLPPGSAAKVSDKLDEEVVLGKSDIKLTPNEQKIYDVMSELWAGNKQKEAFLKDKDPNTPSQYFPRILADPNSIFERVMRGVKSYATEGTVMGSTASFLKSRKIRSLEDFNGNRRVVVIVGKGDKARLVAYSKGQAEDLGPYAFKDIMRRGDRLHQELAPIKKAADEKIMKLNLLKASGKRAEVSKRLIKALESELNDLDEQMNNISAKYPDPLQDVRTWMDKNGKEWKFGEATRREIESNMKARFYRNAYPALVSQSLKLDQLIRQHKWMEAFKSSPEFQQIASIGDQPDRPTDWRLTDVPQLKGIWFHPRLADVLDQFQENANRGDWNAWRNMNRALQGALFLNQPFLHDPNLLTWWFATRGASAWLNPGAYPRMYRSFHRAFNDVLSKNGDYTNYLRLGTPLQLKVMHDFGNRMTDMLKDQLEGNPPLAKRIANILGFANPIHLLNTVGRAATEGLHDILTLQLIHELEERGMPPHEGLRRATAIMPDRRIPPRVMGSRWLSKLMADGSILWFAAYHYAEGRAFTNLIKGVAGQGPDVSRAEALDKIAAIGLLMFAAYPALDHLIKAVTGKNYAMRRAGPTTWPTAIADVWAGRKTPAMAIPSFVSLSPLFTAVPSLFANRNLMNRGLPIYNPRAPYAQQAADIAKFAGQTINPVQMYGDLINGRTTWDDIALNLVGVRRDYGSEPYNRIYGWAYDWARETGNQKLLNRFNQEANEVYPPSVYQPLKQALEDGNYKRARKEVAKLKASGRTDAELERELRPSSHPLSGLEQFESQFRDSLSPEQRQIFDQEKSNRELIYQRYLDLNGQ